METKSKTADREISITRILNAPRELVWEVWTDPKHIVQWWGPTGFSDTVSVMDVRPGGLWNHTMHGPDGTDYVNETIYTEVVKPEHIAYTHKSPTFDSLVTFEKMGDKTKLTMTMVFASVEEYNFVVKEHGAIEGQVQTINRLEEHLAKMIGTKELTITRTFNAPRELVWEAWMNQKHIEQWWGPKGFTNPVCEWDAKKGKKIYIEMKAPDGVHYPMDGEFLEITKPTKIVFASAALDKNGGHLFEILNTITFTEEAGKTKLVLHFIVSNIVNEGPHYVAGMEQGWNFSLDKLAVLLQSLSGK